MLKKILVDEDNETLRELYSALLFLAKYEVTTARNGLEAFKLIQENDFDVVITDYSMQLVNGIDLLNQCLSSTKKLPFFILNSGHCDPERFGGSSKFYAILKKENCMDLMLKTIADAVASSTEKTYSPMNASEEFFEKEAVLA